ncbi:META domain-containing protein [Streptomyces sp. NBC_01498]|uniref:META domain-containing protein n=1 Tax=Streptomyces sp. NBC_01498 TaxID=2975870 RepID=UPI002E7B0457|nr:META domain-containing protein [Streptomyces sp. NBC_01498]
MTTVTVLTSLALLALAGCGSESGRAPAGSEVAPELPLTDVRWSIDSLGVDGKRIAVPAGAGLEIDSKGTATVDTGCNGVGAMVTIDGDTITVGERLPSTQKGCSGVPGTFEEALGAAFEGKIKAKVEDKKLTLTTAGGDTIALSAEKPAPLVGTEWTVNSLVSGETSSSLPKDKKGETGKATLTFAKDGTVSGSLGCNGFSASAKTTGSTITFGPVRSTRKLCPEPGMSLERELLKVLDGKVTYEVHHRALTLTAAGGTGFGATADTPAP